MAPAPGVRTHTAPRVQLVTEIRDRLARMGAPRLQLLLILVLAGTGAFLMSAGLLWLGIASMTLRYAIATVAGYISFIALVRAWIAWQRGSWPDLDVDPDLLDIGLENLAVDLPGSQCAGDARFFAGGRSRFNLSLDLDEIWPVLLALACVLGGLLTVVYVVWTAPVLLAEVALDGAVFATVYRRLHTRDAAHWAATTVRRTWMLALILVLFAAACGFAFERIAPDARSLGGVVRALTAAR